MNMKTLIVGVLALVLAVVASAGVSAYDPYDGVNRVGTYYQYQNTLHYNYQNSYSNSNYYQAALSQNYNYNYIAPPRTGGWFGSSSGWLVGLRAPVYTPVAPSFYTNYYAPVTPMSSYYGGGYGYPRATAGGYPGYSGRVGGVFSY